MYLIKDILNRIEDRETRVRAIYNHEHHRKDVNTNETCGTHVRVDTIWAAIAEGFVWDQTSEGFDHWAKQWGEHHKAGL